MNLSSLHFRRDLVIIWRSLCPTYCWVGYCVTEYLLAEMLALTVNIFPAFLYEVYGLEASLLAQVLIWSSSQQNIIQSYTGFTSKLQIKAKCLVCSINANKCNNRPNCVSPILHSTIRAILKYFAMQKI